LRGLRSGTTLASKTTKVPFALQLRTPQNFDVTTERPLETQTGGVAELNSLALHAASRGDYHALATQLARGASVNASDMNGSTILHHAAKRGDMKMLELYLKYQGDLNSQEHPGVGASTALHHAVREGHNLFVRNLLKAGADVDMADTQGFLPLHLAARLGKVEMSRMLIMRGSNVNAQDVRGRTPFYWAMEMDHRDIAGLLPPARYDWLAVAKQEDVSVFKFPEKPKPEKKKGKKKGKGKGK